MRAALERPPSALWYVIGSVLVVAGIVGAGLGVCATATVLSEQPGAEQRFASSESTTVYFEANSTNVIFAAIDEETHRVNCDVATREALSGVQIVNNSGSLTLNEWEAVFTVSVEQKGDYTISCTGRASDTVGVGTMPARAGSSAASSDSSPGSRRWCGVPSR